MSLRLSVLLALSALALGACATRSDTAPQAAPVKDRAYYFRHLDEAEAQKAQCIQDGVYLKAGIDTDSLDAPKYAATFSDDLLMLNPDNAQLPSCLAAWTVSDAAGIVRTWREDNIQSEASAQKYEAMAAQFKTELEQKYATQAWDEFYPKALYQEKVDFLYTDSTPEEQAKRKALERIFIDKAQSFIQELKTKNTAALSAEMPAACKENVSWDKMPVCNAYFHVLKEKFAQKPLAELDGMKKQYDGSEQTSVSILSSAYFSALEENTAQLEKAYMSDYRRLEADYRQCVKKIGSKIAATHIVAYENHFPEIHIQLYPECGIADQIMINLLLPENLSETVERQIRSKLNLQEKEAAQREISALKPTFSQLSRSPEVEKAKQILAQKYARTPWEDFAAVVEKETPNISPKDAGKKDKLTQQKIISAALGLIFIDKTKDVVEKLEKNSLNKLTDSLPEQCKDDGMMKWMSKPKCNVYFRVFSNKFDALTYEELAALEKQYKQETDSLVSFAYRYAYEIKEAKWAEELAEDGKREAAYRRCLKAIGKTIEQSDSAEDGSASSLIYREPGCDRVYSAMHDVVEEERFKFSVETLLNKKRLKGMPNAEPPQP